MTKTTIFAFVLTLLMGATAFAAGSRPVHEKFASQAEAFVHQMANGKFTAAEANFNDKMKQAASPQALQQLWHQLTGRFGPYQGTGEAKTGAVQGNPVAFVQAQFKKKTLWMEIAFDNSGKIAGMHFVSESRVDRFTGASKTSSTPPHQ